MGTINVYAVGGTGGNIASKIADLHDEKNVGFAELKTYFVDTSRSNLNKSIPDNRVYIYKDQNGRLLDGNGKLRNSNYDIISEPSNIKQILHQFKPTDLNILLHSAGGGTGSVAGPLLAKELLSRHESVLVMMIGTVNSKLDVQNTLKTLKSYENISSQFNVPINMLYRENNPNIPRNVIDNELIQYIYLLTVFFSGQNHGLDSADLRHFFDYSKVTSHQPRLTAFDLFSGTVKVPNEALPIAALSLTLDNNASDLDFMVDYQVTGVVNQTAKEHLVDKLPIHAALFSGMFSPIVARLQNMLKEHDERSSLFNGRQITSSSDQATNDGLIL